VEKEFGKDRKNCLWVESCKETMRVAKRSRVSWKEVRKSQGTVIENMLLGKDDLAL
jgi:hypothetical protein